MFDSKQLAAALKQVAAVVEANKDFLTELDNAIGDGDHGHNLAKGFAAATEKALNNPDPECSKVFTQVGMALISTVGGASGPLYGTAFMRMGSAVAGKPGISLADLPAMLDAAIGGIQQRGKAEKGEKTMLDALMPARDALVAAVAAGDGPVDALSKAVAAAEAGVEFTKTIRATKGRASYLGDRSIGHQDPGATSSMLMLAAIRDYLAGR